MVVKTQDVRTPCYSDIYNIINNYTNTYYLYTLLFAKLYAENVINKAFHKHGVASFTGAWIETTTRHAITANTTSHPLRVRGLKLSTKTKSRTKKGVASFTGAWIETRLLTIRFGSVRSRILYGCVD